MSDTVPSDPTMTVENIIEILNKITENKQWKVMVRLDIPSSLLLEIQRKSSTATEMIQACADYYVNCHPMASWKQVTVILCLEKEFAAARESKLFISTGKYFHYMHATAAIVQPLC